MVDSINRRERKKLTSKKAIMDAAIKLFLQQGFNETSIADIMEEADLGIGTFYNYFQSKEEILKHYLSEFIVKTNKSFASLVKEPKPAAEILTELFLFTAKILDENKFVLPLFLSVDSKHAGAKGATPPADAITFKAIFDRIIKDGQNKGEFRKDIPAAVITEMFHAILQAASFSTLEVSFMENVQYKFKLILEGLVVKKA